MYPGIENVLNEYGYRKIQLNVSGLSLSLKQQGEKGLAVVTIDETTGAFFSREQFGHISESFREFLRKRECYYSIFLYILISEDDDSARRLFEDYENYWRIIPSGRRLMVYESGTREFDELRRPLEQLFPGEGFYGGQQGYEQRIYGNRPVDDRRVRWNGTRIPLVNMCLIALNVLIFFAEDIFLFQDERVVELGALNWYRVLEYGEWYRLFSSMFLHDGIQHIFNNMLVLVYIGSCVEQQIGRLRYGILYLGAGVLAGLTSMVYNMNLNNNVYSLGASGAIFGVMGALLFLVLFKNRYAGGYNVRQIVIMVMFSLYGGFVNQGVDNAAHFGGFIAGFLLAAVLCTGLRNARS